MTLPKLQNTTDIPDNLVWIAYAFSIQPGVEIRSISLRNKPGTYRVHGNWGYYYPDDRRITLCVPQESSALSFLRHKRKYSGLDVELRDRTEWLVMVMAHELRHGYQFQIAGTNALGKFWRERDAEQYEAIQLATFRLKHSHLHAAVAATGVR